MGRDRLYYTSDDIAMLMKLVYKTYIKRIIYSIHYYTAGNGHNHGLACPLPLAGLGSHLALSLPTENTVSARKERGRIVIRPRRPGGRRPVKSGGCRFPCKVQHAPDEGDDAADTRIGNDP